MPFFSVIIPLYNKANFIAETLKSVQDQSFSDFEVIVVNDGSTDRSLDVVQQIQDERIQIISQDNQGASSARNNGARLAKADWIALLDADDIWYKNHLEELHHTIQKLKEVDLASNAYQIKLNSDYIKIPIYSNKIPDRISFINNYFKYSYIDPLFWTSSIGFKKSCFEQINGFDETLKTGQDLDLIIRFVLGKFTLGYNPKVTLLYKRYTQDNLSSSSALEEKQKYIVKHQSHENKYPGLKKYLDINRYSLALQSKMKGQLALYKTMKDQIDLKNLSFKQKVFLSLPSSVLKSLKYIQLKLIGFGLYKSAFN